MVSIPFERRYLKIICFQVLAKLDDISLALQNLHDLLSDQINHMTLTHRAVSLSRKQILERLFFEHNRRFGPPTGAQPVGAEPVLPVLPVPPAPPAPAPTMSPPIPPRSSILEIGKSKF